MLEYMSVKEAAEKWGISERRIQKKREENCIDGVVCFGHAWAIPRNVENLWTTEIRRFKIYLPILMLKNRRFIKSLGNR